MSDNVDYKFYYWGPLLMKFKVPDSFCDELLHRADKLSTKEDHAKVSLGWIDKELSFKDEDKGYFVEQTSKIFNTYLNHSYKWTGNTGQSNKKVKQLFMPTLWINYMKKNDFSPIHEHYYDLSFVLFCDVPKELETENKENKTQSEGAGTLNFIYGGGIPNYINSHTFLPKKGDFFIFPAQLQHWVFPFRSDVTRISIAGNMEFQY